MNNSRDTISVIIPFYKNKNYLIEALASVKKQTYKPLEIIIINDGSNEDLINLKADYCNLKMINQENKGAAAARNVGIKMAKGKYVAFLDSDDIWDEYKLEYQLKALKKSNANWSYHTYKRFKNSKEIKEISQKLTYYTKKIYPLIANSCPIATPSVMVKRNILLENNFKFNDKIKYGEDTCLWLDLSEKYPVTIINNKLCWVRMHGNNAALDAKIQLLARNDLWKYITQNKSLSTKIGPVTKASYLICRFYKKILNTKLIKKTPNCITNTIIKIIYVIPWCAFKILYILGKRGK